MQLICLTKGPEAEDARVVKHTFHSTKVCLCMECVSLHVCVNVAQKKGSGRN